MMPFGEVYFRSFQAARVSESAGHVQNGNVHSAGRSHLVPANFKGSPTEGNFQAYRRHQPQAHTAIFSSRKFLAFFLFSGQIRAFWGFSGSFFPKSALLSRFLHD